MALLVSMVVATSQTIGLGNVDDGSKQLVFAKASGMTQFDVLTFH